MRQRDDSPGDGDDDPPSTGFLPLTLALTLFITGLFVLAPGVRCGTGEAASEPAAEDR